MIFFDFIKLGLNDVLYNPKTKEVYTPNTNQTAKIDEKNSGNVLQNGAEGGIINEERADFDESKHPRDKKGQFTYKKIYSITFNDDGTETIVYKDSENVKNPHSGNKTVNGITYDPEGKPFEHIQLTLDYDEYAAVTSGISTNFSKYEGKTDSYYETMGFCYFFEIHGFGNYNIYDKI